MGKGTQKDQAIAQGSRQTKRTDNKAACKDKAGRKQKLEAPEPVSADLIKILLDHSFPNFKKEIGELPDPRLPERIIYSKEHYFFLGLDMFLFHCGSRSQLENERRSFHFHHNLLTLSETDEDRVATVAAMNYFMGIMNPKDGMELLPGKMTSTLIRSRVLDKFRNSDGEFMIAVDGVHLYTRKGRHPGAVYKEINGEIYSFYYALEAKLVTEDGMGLSLATVFIENEEMYVKQDCELKAFYRLAEVFKERFPKLPICLLLDGLYPNKNVLDICEKNRWSYFITLKNDSLPLLSKEAYEQMENCQEQSIDYCPEPGVYQHLSWAVNLKHEGRRTHLLVCRETRITNKGIETTKFAWLTDSRPNKDSAATLAKEARCRWKIEEAFNVQKNGGYELEHNFGRIGFAMKNYYYLLQIAHMLHQLMIRSDLFPKLQKKFILHEFAQWPERMKKFLAAMAATTLSHFRTMKNFVKRLSESFRNQSFSVLATDPQALGKIQIRLDSS